MAASSSFSPPSFPHKRQEQDLPPGLSTPAVLGYCFTATFLALMAFIYYCWRVERRKRDERIRQRKQQRQTTTGPPQLPMPDFVDIELGSLTPPRPGTPTQPRPTSMASSISTWVASFSGGNRASSASDSDSSRSSFWSYLLPGVVHRRRGEEVFGETWKDSSVYQLPNGALVVFPGSPRQSVASSIGESSTNPVPVPPPPARTRRGRFVEHIDD
ncbi:hypothetical protein PG993_009493 [Apiospora rasikravindrae]|uniref:Transmembrane protein n=1 Tax=Apiospora rasikravindrae TaxID=990691 RepID=A0ABR1SJJ7_9PEZI